MLVVQVRFRRHDQQAALAIVCGRDVCQSRLFSALVLSTDSLVEVEHKSRYCQSLINTLLRVCRRYYSIVSVGQVSSIVQHKFRFRIFNQIYGQLYKFAENCVIQDLSLKTSAY